MRRRAVKDLLCPLGTHTYQHYLAGTLVARCKMRPLAHSVFVLICPTCVSQSPRLTLELCQDLIPRSQNSHVEEKPLVWFTKNKPI